MRDMFVENGFELVHLAYNDNPRAVSLPILRRHVRAGKKWAEGTVDQKTELGVPLVLQEPLALRPASRRSG